MTTYNFPGIQKKIQINQCLKLMHPGVSKLFGMRAALYILCIFTDQKKNQFYIGWKEVTQGTLSMFAEIQFVICLHSCKNNAIPAITFQH